MVFPAEIQTVSDARGCPRKRLRLATSAAVGPPTLGDISTRWMNVRIHDLSASGLLIESPAMIGLDDEITVELPECEGAVARVIWNSGLFYGCQFLDPVTPAVVSASLLKSAFDEPSWAVAEPEYVDEDQLHSDRLLLGARLRIIFGLSVLLWALIIAAVFSLWSLFAAKALSQL
jgi:hypothetical protein